MALHKAKEGGHEHISCYFADSIVHPKSIAKFSSLTKIKQFQLREFNNQSPGK